MGKRFSREYRGCDLQPSALIRPRLQVLDETRAGRAWETSVNRFSPHSAVVATYQCVKSGIESNERRRLRDMARTSRRADQMCGKIRSTPPVVVLASLPTLTIAQVPGYLSENLAVPRRQSVPNLGMDPGEHRSNKERTRVFLGGNADR